MTGRTACSIPAEYAPKSDVSGTGGMFNTMATYTFQPINIVVDTNGDIKQMATSSYSAVQGLSFSVAYPL